MTELESGVGRLQTDHVNGARVLANNALGSLLLVSKQEAESAKSGEEFWRSLCSAATKLKDARPSMDAAIGMALIQGLENIHSSWDMAKLKNPQSWEKQWSRETEYLADMAKRAIEATIIRREQTLLCLQQTFVTWLKDRARGLGRPIRILTLSYSSTMAACLSAALSDDSDIVIELQILESRPAFEGAKLGSKLLHDHQPSGRLSVQVESDSCVAMLSENIDIVLLGADRISRAGDVSNKIGSLPAVMCAKTLGHGHRVSAAVLAETDKIASSDIEERHGEENDRREVTNAWGELPQANDIVVKNRYFEWVPAKWIDTYIFETGVATVPEVRSLSAKREGKERLYFK